MTLRLPLSILALGLIASLACANDTPPGVATGSPGRIIRPVNPLPGATSRVSVTLALHSDTAFIDMMPGPGVGRRDPGTFPVLFSLINRSGGDIPFRIAAPALNTQIAVFTLIDSTGAEIWRSLDVNPLILAPMQRRTRMLRTGTAWRFPCQVPLAPDGVTLPAGTYTLEARINGTPGYGAFASFEVVYAL